MTRIRFEDLPDADLKVETIYEGGLAGTLAGEPISKVLKGSGNQGGIRIAGRAGSRKFVVLYTTWNDRDWPDDLDRTKARLVYFGDNKVPGRPLHETGPGGNLMLKEAYELLHAVKGGRRSIPPFFLFSRHPTPASNRSVEFHGVCVPGYPGVPETEDLVAVWKTNEGQRFQNYRAIFTVLDVPTVKRAWLRDLEAGAILSSHAPAAWKRWVESGELEPLGLTALSNRHDDSGERVTPEHGDR